MTLQQLKEEVWWWNHFSKDVSNDGASDGCNKFFPQNNPNGIPSGLFYWDMGQDAAAFCYELARRFDRNLNLRMYHQLSFDESCCLRDLFGKDKSRNSWCYSRKLDRTIPLEPKPGYSVPSVWKLDIPDNTLVEAFLRFIHEERATEKVWARKSPGQTSKGPAWGWCEAMDREYFLKVKDGGSDPDRKLRRAKAKARESAEIISRHLAEISKSNPDYRKVLFPDFPDKLID